jgi:hypothetical protein
MIYSLGPSDGLPSFEINSLLHSYIAWWTFNGPLSCIKVNISVAKQKKRNWRGKERQPEQHLLYVSQVCQKVYNKEEKSQSKILFVQN